MQPLNLKENYLSMLHFNIRSAPKNMVNFENFLYSLNTEFSLIGLTETWFNNVTADLYDMQRYSSVHNYRTGRTGGGVSIFVKSDISFHKRCDLCCCDNELECVFIEIEKENFSNNSPIVVSVIYRPPDKDINKTNEKLLELLNIIFDEKKACILMGDFNVNLLNYETHCKTKDFVDSLFSLSYIPLINKPTRITRNSSTLIDNIYYNESNPNDSLSGIFYTDISDHFPIFYLLPLKKSKLSDKVLRRKINTKNINNFHIKLRNECWENVLSCDDTQEAFTLFHEKIMKHFNDSFPFIEKNSPYRERKPWLTNDLKQIIAKKNQLFVLYRRKPNIVNEAKYKKIRNKVNSELRRAERYHYHECLEANKKNLKKAWSTLKYIISNKSGCCISDRFTIDNSVVTDKNVIANSFNDFYINIASKLASNIKN